MSLLKILNQKVIKNMIYRITFILARKCIKAKNKVLLKIPATNVHCQNCKKSKNVFHKYSNCLSPTALQ